MVPSHIKTHIYNHHPVLKSTYSAQQFHQVISEIDGLLVQLPTFDSELKPFYQGLTIYDGLLCPVCNKIYISKASIKTHHYQAHPDTPIPQNWQDVKAQQLNTSDHKSFFRIELPDSPPIDSIDNIIKYLHNVQKTYHPHPTGKRLDPRVISPFLQSTGWLHILEGRSVSSLIQLASIPQKAQFPRLAEAVYQLFDSAEPLFSRFPELILQRLVSHDPVKQ